METLSKEECQDTFNAKLDFYSLPLFLLLSSLQGLTCDGCVDTKAKYRVGNIETDWMKVSERVVRQGCIISPI